VVVLQLDGVTHMKIPPADVSAVSGAVGWTVLLKNTELECCAAAGWAHAHEDPSRANMSAV
jgi:hypothetical protein